MEPRRRTTGARGRAARPQRVQGSFRARTRREGLPGWAVALLFSGGALVAVLVVVVGLRVTARRAETPSARPALATAQRLFREGEYELAREHLARIDEGELDPAQTEALAELRAAIEERGAEVERVERHRAGDSWRTMLASYERDHLQGTPEPPKVRLFLKRARTFRERWPDHPGVDWVRRQESRFQGRVDLDAPPTWDDVDWEVKCLVRGDPRNYGEALAIVEGFLERAGGLDAELAKRLRRLLRQDRLEYHGKELAAAERALAEGRTGEAVWGLVHQVLWSGDPELADEAARRLVEVEDLERHLAGYRERYPEKLDALLENAIVRAAVEEGRE